MARTKSGAIVAATTAAAAADQGAAATTDAVAADPSAADDAIVEVDDDDEVFSVEAVDSDVDDELLPAPLLPSPSPSIPRHAESSLSGPIGIVLDLHYLQTAFAVPADASIAEFEHAVAQRCGGGQICARYACDSMAFGGLDVASAAEAPNRKRLHASLRDHGYEVLLPRYEPPSISSFTISARSRLQEQIVEVPS